MRKNSIKNIRINEEVRRQLQEIVMRELKDPRIDPMTSVTKVEVAPDLKTCRAYISVLGSQESLDSTVMNDKKYISRQEQAGNENAGPAVGDGHAGKEKRHEKKQERFCPAVFDLCEKTQTKGDGDH